jgi:hypothetical protein
MFSQGQLIFAVCFFVAFVIDLLTERYKNSQRILQRKLQDINRFPCFLLGFYCMKKFILNVNHTFNKNKTSAGIFY